MQPDGTSANDPVAQFEFSLDLLYFEHARRGRSSAGRRLFWLIPLAALIAAAMAGFGIFFLYASGHPPAPLRDEPVHWMRIIRPFVLPLACVAVLFYLLNRYSMRQAFLKLAGQTIKVRLLHDSMEIRKADGACTIPWSQIRRIEKTGEFWTLFDSAGMQTILPLKYIPIEARAFIDEHGNGRPVKQPVRNEASGGSKSGALVDGYFISTTIDETWIRQAAYAQFLRWAQIYGIGGAIALVMFAVIGSKGIEWFIAAPATICVAMLIAGMIGWMYYTHMNPAQIKKAVEISGGPILFRFEQGRLAIESQSGNSEFGWERLTDVCQRGPTWLMSFNQGVIQVPIPRDQVPDEVVEFVKSKLAANKR
ncbi:MAG: YcxB family protein [Candidatus Sumerlaeia bacterium]